MALHTPDAGRVPALPLSAMLASIPSYPRPVIERLVARMIDHLDRQDGDPDLEDNGDEQDYSVAGWTVGRHGSEAEDAEEDDPAEEDDHSGGSADDAGEADEAECGRCGRYGVDQTRSIGPGNPEAA